MTEGGGERREGRGEVIGEERRLLDDEGGGRRS